MPVLLIHEERQTRTALTNKSLQHLDELKEWYRNAERLMKVILEATQIAGAFRAGIQNSDGALSSEMLTARNGSEDRANDACGMAKQVVYAIDYAKRDQTGKGNVK